MPESKLAIRTLDGFRIVGSMTGGAIPHGLAIAFVDMQPAFGDRQRAGEVRYSVTHILSGKRLGPGFDFDTVREAVQMAGHVADLAEWDRPEIELHATPHLKEQLFAALDTLRTQCVTP